MIKFQALTSHFESFWSIVYSNEGLYSNTRKTFNQKLATLIRNGYVRVAAKEQGTLPTSLFYFPNHNRDT